MHVWATHTRAGDGSKFRDGSVICLPSRGSGVQAAGVSGVRGGVGLSLDGNDVETGGICIGVGRDY